mmetsp:Transcript_24306/g.23918  ORF Transcript_24306/g.23918 Transcript_24306/m.23918 type:complete len:230 (-) Transcript_24306:249-938(-)
MEEFVLLGSSQLALDLVRVDDSGKVSTGQDASVKHVALLLNTLCSVVSEHLIQRRESILGPDDESSEVTSRSELEKVESVDTAGIHSWEVLGHPSDKVVLISIDDEGTLPHDISRVPHLSMSGSHLPGVSGPLQFLISSKLSQGGKESLGGVSVQVVHNQRELRDFHHSVSSGQDQGSHSRSSQSRSNGVPLLVEINFSVPSPPSFQGSKHSSLSAHVTKGTLSRSAGT